MAEEMTAIVMGVHVLDVLVRPVEEIPEGQGGELVEQIRITAAGSAGGAALVLAKLGESVQSAGAVGTDAGGEMLAGPFSPGRAGTPPLREGGARPSPPNGPSHSPPRARA